MAHHKSAKKRIRQSQKRRLLNRYYKKTSRTQVKNLTLSEDAAKAKELLPDTLSLIDKLAKKGIIHKNKAANLKSKLTKKVNQKAAAK